MFLNLFLNLSIIAGLSSALIITQCVNNKDVALTFDDGPSIGTTRRLMDYLESENIRATFHVVTKHINYVEVQEIMKDIISRGHVLGYRLEAEWTMQNVTNEGMQGAVEPKLVRTSYNATDLVKNALVASGLIVTMPNFETYDYRSEFNYDTMIQRFQSAKLSSVISVQREFAINLFDTTKQFIQFLRENGYNIVTLQKCLQIDNIYAEDFVIQSLRTFAVNDPATATADPFEHENSSSPSKATFSSAFLFSLALVMVAIQLIL
jgi:peptidoglycan/xylan/chitin deacetylase (PgdA/CDA1 family)